MSFLVIGSSNERPIRRLMAKNVRSGLVTPWRLAGWPTSRSPSSVNATMEGVVRDPSEFSMTLGVAPSMTATQEFVVPRSMPITLAMLSIPVCFARPRGPEAARPWRNCLWLEPSLRRFSGPRCSVSNSAGETRPSRTCSGCAYISGGSRACKARDRPRAARKMPNSHVFPSAAQRGSASPFLRRVL